MHPCVAVVQKNEQPEDEETYSQELVILEGKELHIVKYTPDSIAFDFVQLTTVARSIGWRVITEWEVLDGRAFAVVERASSDPGEPAQPEGV
ncbi:hypothetical protein [Arthrobacter sp. 162MFSha1.1]|uniref:hypothetical protein n=1 Tax=Arthrobacter sp. 162MFSha1.1 TaxID=1151119 RepID=UPI000362B67C|nr:hypothetical protein [Arthrobacter sp. 162MFSha1.1]